MTESIEALAVAEQYLKEMFEADDSANFELYTRHFEDNYLQGFTEDVFRKDIEQMQQRNGPNQGYEFLGALRNETIDDLDVYRTAWKGIYAKRDAIVEMGVYKKNDRWHVLRSFVM